MTECIHWKHWMCIACGLLCSVAIFGWQYLNVHLNYGGNWTALFMTGSKYPVPPTLASENIYTFPNLDGYDGQFYHYIAHDPLFRCGLSVYVDDPRQRYGRILVPALTSLIAGGDPTRIDAAYRFVVLGFIFLGTYWLSLYALRNGRNPLHGLFFAVLPATVISANAYTIDVSLLALCVAFYLFAEESVTKLLPILALAGLARETGLLLGGACVISAGLRKQWRKAAILMTAFVPWLAWNGFVILHTEPSQLRQLTWIPFGAFIRALLHPVMRTGSPAVDWLFVFLDYVQMAGIVVGVYLAARLWRRNKLGAVEIACLLFAFLVVVLQKYDVWMNFHAYGRIFSPLLLLLAMRGFEVGSGLLMAPLGLVIPRFISYSAVGALLVLTQAGG